MIPRETIQEKLTFGIKPPKEYKEQPFCTWKQLIKTKGPLLTDAILEFTYVLKIEESPSFGSMEPDEDYPRSYYTPSVIVIRPRPENDEEYEKRMKNMEETKKQTEEKEKLEYLRLKAKFEK